MMGILQDWLLKIGILAVCFAVLCIFALIQDWILDWRGKRGKENSGSTDTCRSFHFSATW